jgi:ribonuclease HI
MVREAMANYAEKHNMLSSDQGGFRAHRGTQQQLELFTSILEDARLCNKDLYLLQSDFVEAFDMVNHDKLLVVLFDLGFPTDAIEVVKHLYQGMKTRIKSPHGESEFIPVDRGTIQGDSLSPFLFLTYLEPLLRWLNVGGRGYSPGVLQKQGRNPTELTCSHAAYADDLVAMADNLPDFKIQSSKVSQYATWADLPISGEKTTVTGALYASHPNEPLNVQILSNRCSNIDMQGQPIKMHDPRMPFRLLGVMYTLDLDWQTQFETTLRSLSEQATNLAHSDANLGQKERITELCLRAKLKYSLPLMCFTNHQLETLNHQLERVIRKAYGLPPGAPTAILREQKQFGGLGHHSLIADCTFLAAKSLTQALNDQGKLGALSRALLQRQVDMLTREADRGRRFQLAQYNLRLKQLMACRKADILIFKDTRQAYQLPDLGIMQSIIDQDYHTTPQLAPIKRQLRTLQEIGVYRLSQIVTRGRDAEHYYTLDIEALKHLTAIPGQQTHKTAMFRITEYLTRPMPGSQEEEVPYRKQKPATLPQTQRRVHNSQLRWITEQLHREDKWHLQCPPPPLPQAAAHTSSPNSHAAGKQLPPLGAGTKRARLEGTSRFREHNVLPECPVPQYKDRTRWAKFCIYQQTARSIRAGDVKNLSGIYNQLCGHRDALKALLACRQGQESIKQGRRYRPSGFKQRQWQVCWEETIMEQWEIELNQQLGYIPIEGSIRVATLQEVEEWDRVVCEYCLKPDDTNTPLYHCPICFRAYHQECAQSDKRHSSQTQPTLPITDDGWHCPECVEYESKGRAAAANYKNRIQSKWVKWQPQWEDEATVKANPEGAKLIQEWHNTRTKQVRNTHTQPKDGHLSNLERQTAHLYCPLEARTHNTVGEDCRHLIQVHLDPIDPGVDIIGTGNYTLQLRNVTRASRERGTGAVMEHEKEMACLYNPEGQCIGTMDPERAALLHNNYVQTTRSRPDMAQKMKAGTFAQELALLLARYKQGVPIAGSNRTVEMKNHWATPPAIYSYLQDKWGVHKERFASPLNYHPDMQAYWSCHERDQLFGAQHNAYSVQWTGYSVANPEYEANQLEKAVAWAVHSARATDTPTLTVFVLPAWSETSNTAYLKWTRKFPDNCKVLLRVPKQSFKFLPPDAAFMVKDAAHATGHPKWDVNILAVFNAPACIDSAKEQEFRVELCKTINEALRLQGPHQLSEAWLQEWLTLSQQQQPLPPARGSHLYRPPQAVLQAPPEQNSPYSLPPPASSATLVQQLRSAYITTDPLRFNPASFAYTDGSRKISDIGVSTTGSGVYIPSQGPGSLPTEVGVSPAEPGGPENTILRAELVAANVALQMGATAIATDSKTTQQLIWKRMTRPAAVSPLHRHHKLVADSVERAMQLARQAGQAVHFYKVKAHSGVPGNEHADRIAKSIADGEVTNEEYHIPTSNDRISMYWPYTENTSLHPTTGSLVTTITPASNHEGALKKHIYSLMSLGHANVNTVYYRAFQAQRDRIHTGHLEHLANSSKLSRKEKLRRVQYLSGCLYTNKRAKWYKHSNTSACPNCRPRQEDGGGHVMLACSALSTSHTARHHALARVIGKATATGNQGNNLEVCFTDIGSLERWEQEGMPEMHRPVTDIPSDLIDRETFEACHSRPDIIIWKRTHQPTEPNEIWLVEFKCCSDSDPEHAAAVAQEQHKQLQLALQQKHPDTRVRIKIGLVGVAGTIYHDLTIAFLRDLGIEGNHLKKTTEQLSILAVQHMQKIWEQRWHLIKNRRSQAQVAQRAGVG